MEIAEVVRAHLDTLVMWPLTAVVIALLLRRSVTRPLRCFTKAKLGDIVHLRLDGNEKTIEFSLEKSSAHGTDEQ